MPFLQYLSVWAVNRMRCQRRMICFESELNVVEEVFVDALDREGVFNADLNVMFDHQLGQFLTVH